MPPSEPPTPTPVVVWSSEEEPSEALLAQYKIAVDSAVAVSAWRHTANRFGVTVTVSLVAAVGWLLEKDNPIEQPMLPALACVLGAVSSVFWLLVISSCRALNSAKFKVIHEMEARLPVRFFAAEWEHVKRKEVWWEHIPFSKIEQILAASVGVLFAIAAVCLWSSIEPAEKHLESRRTPSPVGAAVPEGEPDRVPEKTNGDAGE